jgi:hypothetical protein
VVSAEGAAVRDKRIHVDVLLHEDDAILTGVDRVELASLLRVHRLCCDLERGHHGVALAFDRVERCHEGDTHPWVLLRRLQWTTGPRLPAADQSAG